MKRPILYKIGCYLLSMAFLACSEDLIYPDLSFNATDNNGLVSFTNYSKNADTFLWDFGDGTTSTDSDPEHRYQRSGIYLVALEGKGPSGKFSFQKQVEVTIPTGTLTVYTTNTKITVVVQVYIDDTYIGDINRIYSSGVPSSECLNLTYAVRKELSTGLHTVSAKSGSVTWAKTSVNVQRGCNLFRLL